jgi:hypothetical protein
VNSVGRIIGSLRTGGDATVLFDELKTSLSAPLAGMGISFSASLFGLAGSLILGFLDLQAGQAQGRFYTELEDWLAATTATGEAALTDPRLPLRRSRTWRTASTGSCRACDRSRSSAGVDGDTGRA